MNKFEALLGGKKTKKDTEAFHLEEEKN